MHAHRRKMQVVFQDPYSSLNPRMTAGEIVGEPLFNYGLAAGKERADKVRTLFARVGLRPEHMRKYPHEFSGGQRQRLGIARALAVGPKLIVCDEPVSALDVSVQAQVINLMMDLQDAYGLSYIFIAHDLAVVEHISHRVAVMYLGKIVELTDKKSLFTTSLAPLHRGAARRGADPETQGRQRRQLILAGDVPSPIKPSARLPIPHALSLCRGRVQTRRATDPGSAARPRGRLPSAPAAGRVI